MWSSPWMPYRTLFRSLNPYTMMGDAIFVMDQIKDKKNQDDAWLEGLAIKEAMKKLNDRENPP